MKLKKLLVLFGLLLTAGYITGQQTTDVRYLSGKGSDDAVLWDFFCTGGSKCGEWTKIKVPSCWETEGFGTLNYGHDKNKSDESGLYKTRFTLPENWKGKRLFVVFEGAMTDAQVSINGRKAGEKHQGAFYRFKREITNLVSFKKENLLEVKVDKMSTNESINQAERKCDFWIFGGLFRPVYLEAVPKHFIEYTSIDARHTGEFAMNLFADAPLKGLKAEVEILDKSNTSVGRLSTEEYAAKTNELHLSGKLTNVRPWSAEDPQMYMAVVSLKQNGKLLHKISEKIGFRTIDVRQHDGVYVNNEKIRFKGVNRHSHWVTTGRTTNKNLSISDVKLMKEMNMNAVRMSHYPPDSHFLEACDSLGLYVIDELCAWQYPPYDTEVGSKLVREMLTRDLNHPSIVFWSNGNEGGFNLDLDPLFPKYDLQKRAVLHPWSLHDGINTVHYIRYNCGIGNMHAGRDIFMPTEILHGLYDGGHGAGLDDYWKLMLDNPLSAGMFLWDFADQAVLRKDKNGFLDTDRDHGADGILGPYREKEGSFYTIKQIWSPIQLEKRFINSKWNGKLFVENHYNFTNASECTFSYKLAKVEGLDKNRIRSVEGRIASPDIEPGCKAPITLNLQNDWKDYDFLYITVTDKNKQDLFTWTYEISTPERITSRLLQSSAMADVVLQEDDNCHYFQSGGLKIAIDKHTGLLKEVSKNGTIIPLSNGPVIVSDKNQICRSVKKTEVGGKPAITVEYGSEKSTRYTFTWSMQSGTLKLDYNYRPDTEMKMAGITFDFPEQHIKGAKLLANGPYRVYSNRMKGGSIGLWEKTYNNAITGESWEYPEFKGYYSMFYAMQLQCDTPFEIYSSQPDLILHLFTPEHQKQYKVNGNYTLAEYPKGNISFMHAIPAVGTKFKSAEYLGPQSQPHNFKGNDNTQNAKGVLYFKF